MRLRGALRRLRYRLSHGFWPWDVWNLDIALAAWLSVRLRALSAEATGMPPGYGGWMSTEREYAAWTADLLRHATSCSRYAKRKFLCSVEDELVLSHDYKAALRFVAEYVEYLWT